MRFRALCEICVRPAVSVIYTCRGRAWSSGVWPRCRSRTPSELKATCLWRRTSKRVIQETFFLSFYPPPPFYLSLWYLADSGSRWEVFAVKVDRVFMALPEPPFPFFPFSQDTRQCLWLACKPMMYTTHQPVFTFRGDCCWMPKLILCVCVFSERWWWSLLPGEQVEHVPQSSPHLLCPRGRWDRDALRRAQWASFLFVFLLLLMSLGIFKVHSKRSWRKHNFINTRSKGRII